MSGKSISGHHFETMIKPANNNFQYHRETVLIKKTAIHSYKKKYFPHVRNFTLTCGPFSCLTNVLFIPIFYGKFCIFFKFLINLRAHALQSENNKFGQNFRLPFFDYFDI